MVKFSILIKLAMQASKPLNKSNVNEHPSPPPQTSDKNLLEISIQPEQFFSLMQSGALANFSVKINVSSNK